MHSNSALQYTSKPEEALKQLCDLGAKRMNWQRMTLSHAETHRELQSSLLSDNGPGALAVKKEKTVKYTRTSIPEQTFLDAHINYVLTERGSDWFRFSLKAAAAD